MRLPSFGRRKTSARICRITSTTIVLCAGSFTVMTSGWIPSKTFLHPLHIPQGFRPAPAVHCIAAASIRASVCFPEPSGPQIR